MSETSTADSDLGTCEVTSADLEIPDDLVESLDLTAWSCSRPVWNDDQCVWHADATDKPPEELAATVEDGEPHGARLSNVDLSESSVLSGTRAFGADFSEADLREANLSEVDLREADLSGADLRGAKLSEVDLRATNLSEATLQFANLSEADLRKAKLSGADLRGANLPENLFRANLSEADLREADLSEADLRRANLSEADLRRANLSEANLQFASLSEADLRGVDLSNKNLSSVNLSRADLREVSMVGMSADQSTTVGKMCTGLRTPSEYDELAQAYHELKEALSKEGLSQRARRARALEQQARTAESWVRFKQQLTERASPRRTVGGVRQWVFPPWPGPEIRIQFLTAVGGTLSRFLTGYGTRPLYVLLWTAAIVLLTTILYALGPAPHDGGWQGGPFYYSVVTFVTAPPHPPKDVWTITQAAVLIETYLGTALIVLLGYVLGTRERV